MQISVLINLLPLLPLVASRQCSWRYVYCGKTLMGMGNALLCFPQIASPGQATTGLPSMQCNEQSRLTHVIGDWWPKMKEALNLKGWSYDNYENVLFRCDMDHDLDAVGRCRTCVDGGGGNDDYCSENIAQKTILRHKSRYRHEMSPTDVENVLAEAIEVKDMEHKSESPRQALRVVAEVLEL